MPTGEEFAREIAKQLPIKEVYSDLAQPATKQAGQLAEDLVKVLQLALAPVQLLAAVQDRYRRFVDRAIRRVPEENRVSPAPQIVGPVFEAIRYEPEDTPTDQMFSQLLSRACDALRAGEAHPAFPFVIRQLSSDEARMIAQLKDERVFIRQTQELDRSINYFHPAIIQEHRFNNLHYTTNIGAYLDHLKNLGLVIIETMRAEPIRDSAKSQTGNEFFQDATLSTFGKQFVKACIAE